MKILPLPMFSLRNWITYKLEAAKLRRQANRVNKPLTAMEKYDLMVFRELCWMHRHNHMRELSYSLETDGKFDTLRKMVRTYLPPEN